MFLTAVLMGSPITYYMVSTFHVAFHTVYYCTTSVGKFMFITAVLMGLVSTHYMASTFHVAIHRVYYCTTSVW